MPAMLRTGLALLGLPFRAAALGLLRIYRATLSGALGPRCRFYPSCSSYAEEAIRSHGFVKGTALATWRVLRCSPLTRGGVDHVPERAGRDTGRRAYDAVIRTDRVSPVERPSR